MGKPKEILNPADYSNYRNVRAAAVLYIFLSVFLVLGGIALLLSSPEPEQPKPVPPVVAIGLAAAGVAGFVAGLAIRRGNRRLTPLIYTVGFLYLIYFPIGTIVSVVVLRGLARYLNSADEVKNAATPAS
ncbi:MAG: hypothetical protein B9S33_16710 [Pedosphaera sp. Tous-C6FEB]|nr:MAG: hypothetical protein B9S33_16710 [Pedosphaera sp. Tous-C6FEB]